MKIAIIGSGIAGNTVAHHLHREHEITLFESASHIGGHTHTHSIDYDGERHAMGLDPLPASLSEAIRVMETSELVAETLGEHVFDFFLRNKRAEWSDYRRQVTAFELDRYLSVL